MTAKKRKRKCRWVWDDKYGEFKTACGHLIYSPFRGDLEGQHGTRCGRCGKPIEVVK